MYKKFKLRLSGRQHAALSNHLFPGDNKEAVALALCGVGKYQDMLVACVHKIIEIPYDQCSVRTEDQLTWSTELLPGLLKDSGQGRMILKIHSHPTGYPDFSEYDNHSDKDLFKGIAGWLDTDYPGMSAIMLPDGKMIARIVKSDSTFSEVRSIIVAGPDILYWNNEQDRELDESLYSKRTMQTFGSGTTRTLSSLSIGVVGVSGTGSPVTDMLARLGVGELVLVDGDVVEEVNVGRIYNSGMSDVREQKKKVQVIGDAISRYELPVNVVEMPMDLFNPEVIQRLAQCDVIFGCMDSYDGRNALNKLCVYYSIPYFDLGVFLDADGKGSVSQVCGTVHYMQPDGSSLFSRKVYTGEQLRAADMRRSNPKEYENQIREKYIRGIQEERPAVISVNTLIASLAVNEFLARIHQFRDDPNDEISTIRLSLTQNRFITEPEGDPCGVLAKKVGLGDVRPLLDMPILSIGGSD
ncbi:ThiF family adenylyltransferase [Desulfosporosinus sp.]|uniref:ThiF family adenylyltransferase n=1 Tax=Desulfosporosinus sp. TaxID=157907 RepID=UPI0025BECFD3|nr:ThiF family adenylyltransferase [Desulfosporosinus sp.]MBC2724482.1 ThiF family adenylyltransferase [Desulfosporosinus sp.]MBC2727397.1 ThiF family adenylyltransferase [Desulfosporosinus sp.]